MTAQHFQDGRGAAGGPGMQVQPVPGGCVLRGTDGPPLPFQLTQGIVLAVGAALAGVAAVLLIP